ncbi:MAG: hypothetical protein FJY73_06145 [Candidatus Eisenbacteria bacterium]|nr:hypothetical protein [Candidatus Eisenbacteria bacterium]
MNVSARGQGPSGFERDSAALLRALFLHPSTIAREDFARFSLQYLRSFLRSNRRGWAYLFRGEFLDAVDGAADRAVSLLLRERRGGGSSYPFLARGLEGVRRAREGNGEKVSEPPLAFAEWVRAARDEDLALLLRALLRRLGRQALHAEWKERNRECAGVWRRFRVHIEASRALALLRDTRGWIVAGSSADLRRRPVSSEEVLDLLGAGCRDERDAVRVLETGLAPCEEHGGYVFLLDLVRAFHALATEKMAHPGERTGALPQALEVRLARGGLPESLFVERVVRTVEAKARLYLEADERKPFIPPVDGRLGALSEIAAEMVCRDFGMGRPYWSGLSQKGLVGEVLPGVTEDLYRDLYQRRLDYTVRRLRGWLAMRGERTSLRSK